MYDQAKPNNFYENYATDNIYQFLVDWISDFVDTYGSGPNFVPLSVHAKIKEILLLGEYDRKISLKKEYK